MLRVIVQTCYIICLYIHITLFLVPLGKRYATLPALCIQCKVNTLIMVKTRLMKYWYTLYFDMTWIRFIHFYDSFICIWGKKVYVQFLYIYNNPEFIFCKFEPKVLFIVINIYLNPKYTVHFENISAVIAHFLSY